MQKRTGFVKRYRGTVAFDDIHVGRTQIPTQILFAISQNATQYGVEIQAQVCDSDGNVVPGVYSLDFWLSDNADGSTLTAAGVAGAVSAKAGGGLILGALTANKAFRCVTAANGTFTLVAIDGNAPNFLYGAASLPSFGVVGVSRKTVAGDYHP